jgi:16S rRNA (uracil1498-N3)-methyltransferase
MHIFYAPDISGNTFILDEKESRHSIRVLRMTRGTIVRLIDGKGNLYEGFISDPDPRKCMISISEVKQDYEKRSYRLHIAISPIKNPERFEWFVEKCVEIGVDEITPLICRNTEKQSVKHERINNIIVSAMKQSIKSSKTILNEPCTFNDFIADPGQGINMIAHCSSSTERVKISEVYMKNENAVIMIGPEGDFSNDEISAAVISHFTPVHLGSSRLRTETAGVAACHSIYFINQEQ